MMQKILFLLVTLLPCKPAIGRDKVVSVELETLNIQISYPKSAQKIHGISNDDMKSQWEDSCDKFGANFLTGTGVYGFGVFEKVNCGLWESRIEDESKSWFLKVSVGSKITTFALYPDKSSSFKKSRKKPISSMRIASNEIFLNLVADPEISKLLAFGLLDKSPVLLRLNEDLLNNAKNEIRLGAEEDSTHLPPPPPTLDIYRLEFNHSKSIWVPKPLGQGSLQQSQTNDTKTSTWTLKKRLKISEDDFIYAHNKQQTRSNQKKIRSSLKTLLSAAREKQDKGVLSVVGDSIGNLANTGYVGVRYGLGLLGEDLIKDANFFGLVAELRSGPLDGLKFYYDYWPIIKGGNTDGDTSFGGSRATVGWSFRWEIPTQLLTGIDITPKVGLWDFQIKLLVEDAKGVKIPLDFNTKNATSTELEIGLESAQKYILLRGWAAQAISLLDNNNTTSIKTSRIGTDLFITGPKMGSGNLSFLIFIFGERVTFEKSKESLPSESISEIFYTQVYAGGGLAISW